MTHPTSNSNTIAAQVTSTSSLAIPSVVSTDTNSFHIKKSPLKDKDQSSWDDWGNLDVCLS